MECTVAPKCNYCQLKGTTEIEGCPKEKTGDERTIRRPQSLREDNIEKSTKTAERGGRLSQGPTKDPKAAVAPKPKLPQSQLVKQALERYWKLIKDQEDDLIDELQQKAKTKI